MLRRTKVLPVRRREILDQVIAELLQQRRFAVTPRLLQQLHQRLFQPLIARRQRRDKQLWIQPNRQISLLTQHRRPKGALMFLASRRKQRHAHNRITPQTAGEQFAPQHAAQADQNVIGNRRRRAQAAGFDQT